MSHFLNAQQLHLLASTHHMTECQFCNALNCSGWESIPTDFQEAQFSIIGTLRFEGAENIWQEYHPLKTSIWSADAPIAPRHYPYNRSDVLQCQTCLRIYLSYTEYGGYYLERRLRKVDSQLIVLKEPDPVVT